MTAIFSVTHITVKLTPTEGAASGLVQPQVAWELPPLTSSSLGSRTPRRTELPSHRHPDKISGGVNS